MTDESNGNNTSSRLDRIEAALELIIGEHEQFRAEHKMLLRSQVLMQDSLEKLTIKVDEVGDKLNGLIGVVAEMQRVFDNRLRRLEGQ
ncbi:MAG: hypothetical protein HY820_05360 [Acidobacteria bacterium]|nr:hypothetical protein [Acidobacteriota bacterium]